MLFHQPLDCWIFWWQSGKLNVPETCSLLPKTPTGQRCSLTWCEQVSPRTLILTGKHILNARFLSKCEFICRDSLSVLESMWGILSPWTLCANAVVSQMILHELEWLINIPLTMKYSYINNPSIVNWSMTLNSKKWSWNQTHKLILWHLSYKYFWDYPFAVYLQLDYILRSGVLISQRPQSKFSLINTQTISEAVLQYLVQWSAWNRKAL